MSVLSKKKFGIIIIAAAVVFVAVITVMILVFAPSKYELVKSFTTADNAHEIALYASYPTAPTNARATVKVVCADNSADKEIECEKFELVIPKTGELFSLEDDTADGCSLIVHDHRGDKTIRFVWNEIFA